MTKFTDLLAAPTAEKRYLVQLSPYDPGSSAVVDLYYSTHGFISEPADTPSNQEYLARVNTALDFTRTLFSSGKTSGQSVAGQGTLVLANTDGALDGLQAYGWGARRVRVWLGSTGFALSEYGLVFDGTAQGLTYDVDGGTITVNLRDKQFVLDREIQTLTFAGTGTEEGGVDVAGTLKPMPWGICRNVTPIYLGADTGKHMFAVGDGPIVGVLTVRDLGIPLTFNAGTPGPGEWTYSAANATITLGGKYNGPLTCDVIGRRYRSTTSTTSWTVAIGSKAFAAVSVTGLAVGMQMRVMRTSALHATWGDGKITGISGSNVTINVTSISGTAGPFTDWTLAPWGTTSGILVAMATLLGITSFDASSPAALDTLQPATVGWWIAQGGGGLQQMDGVADGAGCFYQFEMTGAFTVGRLDAPGTPDLSLGEGDLIEDTLVRQATEEPNYQISVGYGRNWTGAMTGSQLAAAVSDADRAFLTQEWRQSVQKSSPVLTAYPQSLSIQIDGTFDEATAAAAEATRLLAMYDIKRDYFEAEFKLQPLAVDLAQTLNLTRNRYGLTSGKAFRIVDLSVTFDDNANDIKVGIWG